jgi:hypothetical protein
VGIRILDAPDNAVLLEELVAEVGKLAIKGGRTHTTGLVDLDRHLTCCCSCSYDQGQPAGLPSHVIVGDGESLGFQCK